MKGNDVTKTKFGIVLVDSRRCVTQKMKNNAYLPAQLWLSNKTADFFFFSKFGGDGLCSLDSWRIYKNSHGSLTFLLPTKRACGLKKFRNLVCIQGRTRGYKSFEKGRAVPSIFISFVLWKTHDENDSRLDFMAGQKPRSAGCPRTKDMNHYFIRIYSVVNFLAASSVNWRYSQWCAVSLSY